MLYFTTMMIALFLMGEFIVGQFFPGYTSVARYIIPAFYWVLYSAFILVVKLPLDGADMAKYFMAFKGGKLFLSLVMLAVLGFAFREFLGAELKSNIKRAWWKKFVQENPYNVGLDAAILMNPQTWVASGHLAGFSDPLMDCRECKERFRADKLIEDWAGEHGVPLEKPLDAFSQAEMKDFIETNAIPCPSCGKPHDFDYPACPHCGHDYQAKPLR